MERNNVMGILPDMQGREVVIGGGVHAAIYAATRVAMGFPRPVVLERENVAGGVFARYLPFWLNSANDASLKSVLPGASRILPETAVDTLNWLPNCRHQIDSMTEYPSSADVALAVARNLREYAELYTGTDVTIRPYGSRTFLADGRSYIAGRLIDARGIEMPRKAPGPAVTAEVFLSGFYAGRPEKVALIGDQDTAAICAEYLLGMAPAAPSWRVRKIAIFGTSMPSTKEAWISTRHARYLGLARHLPQAQTGAQSMIRPYASRAEVTVTGPASCVVNGETFDAAVYCTGFTSAVLEQGGYSPDDYQLFSGCRRAGTEAYIAGAAATPLRFTESEEDLGFARFPRNAASIFRLGRRTAQLAASLPGL